MYRQRGVLEFLTVHSIQGHTKLATGLNVTVAVKTPYLGADLGGNADKLRVGGECRQVLHGCDQGGGGDATLVAVVLGEVPIQGLMGQTQRSPLGHGNRRPVKRFNGNTQKVW